MSAPLRVWLEPGYDGGRCAAWLLDLPGCFAWRSDRAGALAAAPGAARDHLAWLARHGERVALAVDGPVEVAEERPGSVVEGYERKTCFAAERRAVTRAELDAVRRRLAWAREDLLALLPALVQGDAADAVAGAGETGADGRPERELEAVARHLAGSETWLGSRLDPDARYGGSGPGAPLREHLAATRAWLLDQLERAFERDPALARIDGKGEEWTLAKVLRRVAGHSLDHLGELERRIGQNGWER
jgi:hypothetical protein